MITAIVNTCALGGHGNAGSAGKPYSHRAELLERDILPGLRRHEISQVIVVGEYKPGEGYQYIHSPSVYKNCRDVLAQRQAGFEAAKFDWIFFQMDDHSLSANAPLDSLRQCDADIVTPYRHGRGGTLLNSGFNDARGISYVHTHGIFMRRHAVETCPWIRLPPIHAFDIVHTMWFQDAGLTVARMDPGIIDVE